jgi:hypothetical protein
MLLTFMIILLFTVKIEKVQTKLYSETEGVHTTLLLITLQMILIPTTDLSEIDFTPHEPYRD